MRALLIGRAGLDRILAVGGVVVILLQVLWIADTQIQIVVVLVGIIANQLGVWGLAKRLMPDRRKYLLLRSEANHFMTLVRQLNTHAVAGAGAEKEAAQAKMHESVDRMASVAGIEDEDS